MSSTEDLRDIARSVAGDATVTETQAETPSHDPVDEEASRLVEAAAAANEDGLEEAIEGGETADGGRSVA